MDLAAELRALRSSRGLTLRDVEERFGVSNGYLSQVENGKVARPSPDVLLKLSKAYEVPYEMLMTKAGYILPRSEQETKNVPAFVFSAAKEFSQQEWDEVQLFFKFLRARRDGNK